MVNFIKWWDILMPSSFRFFFHVLFSILLVIILICISFVLLDQPLSGPGLQHINILYFFLWAWIYIPIYSVSIVILIFPIATISKSSSLIIYYICTSLCILLIWIYFVCGMAFYRSELIDIINWEILTHKLFLLVQVDICQDFCWNCLAILCILFLFSYFCSIWYRFIWFK